MVIHDFEFKSIWLPPSKQIRYWSLIRMLYWPLRSPLRASRRKPGSLKSQREVADPRVPAEPSQPFQLTGTDADFPIQQPLHLGVAAKADHTTHILHWAYYNSKP